MDSIFEYQDLRRLVNAIYEWFGAWGEYTVDMEEYDEKVKRELKRLCEKVMKKWEK